ncbi:MAG: hypothetical protein UT32_C0001G0020 [Parcubacteria group bacterium GW2011_GWC2_39_14]|nr:MAG: hypothetical protein UT32_C0001G0020 [Parcubacteria group bacterium GW2011_GWC2_39_14]KKR55444.1 MAG: hypothetical protein UT91_C0001G0019 [Parcubacteria group bacterium GW2011_GWA2_40_23]
MSENLKTKTYFVKGLHCPSCEILIERELLENKNIQKVEASLKTETVVIDYNGEFPSAEQLNHKFNGDGYQFSEKPFVQKGMETKNIFGVIGVALGIIILFLGLNKLGLTSIVNVNEDSSLPLFFIFGIIAGLSSCAALVGGLILSMTKQWNAAKTQKGLAPYLTFNIGRLISYAFFGFLLGALGKTLNLSLNFGPFLVILVSLIMFVLALQMLGVKAFNRFRIGLPKFISQKIQTNNETKSHYSTFILGALTFFLPCGFTITAQSMALLSGNALQGALIMISFALGTLPTLLLIGYSSEKLTQNKKLSDFFLKVAGILVLFFAFYTFNAQLNVLGFTSFNDLSKKETTKSANLSGLAPMVNGQQLLKMNASASGYTPNSFKIKVGVPVRWEITDTGTSGCTNAVIAKSFFADEIPLTPGKVSVKEFTPTKTGRFKFSCWMGMVSGIIEVVDPATAAAATSAPANTFTASGAENAGGSCGGGGGCGCSGGAR